MRARAAANPGEPGGRIVNVGSRAALAPPPASPPTSWPRPPSPPSPSSLAEELRPEQILVNASSLDHRHPGQPRQRCPAPTSSRWAKPADIAETILFLASPSNAVTTGALVPVDGPTA
jgi:NAD(P)-dependent dehydrogenase (short-subunit alcohol dehydrogenase family)